MHDSQFWQMLTAIATVLTSISTVIAVFVGIRYKKYLENKNKPNLTVHYNEDNPFDNVYLKPYYKDDISEEIWLRVRIVNDSNTTIAQDVGLKLKWIKREKGEVDNRPAWWFKVSNEDKKSIEIYPDFEQSYDIAYVSNNIHNDDDLGFYLTLVKEPILPWSKQKKRIEEDSQTRLYVGGAYTILFALLCRNADVQYYAMRINVLGPGPNNKRSTNCLLGEEELKSRISCDFIGSVDKNYLNT